MNMNVKPKQPLVHLLLILIVGYCVGYAGSSRTNDTTRSSGVINVYFNKSVDHSIARGELSRVVSLNSKLIERIDATKFSIDVALYNMSGTVGDGVATALIRAKSRGVKIRYILEKDEENKVPINRLKAAGVPIINDAFDPINNGSGLMHNKYLVFDFRDSSSALDDWVWTGSWNVTDPGTNSDMQNVVEIQDQSLAKAYTMEFEEMWGSSSDLPDASRSRFGFRKLDNTQHLFTINGTPVECYFSPSDRTTSRIITALGNARHSINFALLTFTRSDIASTLKSKKDAGAKVRGVLDNSTDTGTQYGYLTSNGMEIRLDPNAGFLHHKYAVVDAERTDLSGIVITGSHNWSNSAERDHNENTLIIHSNRIANLYLQEFAARYKESGGTDNIVVRLESPLDPLPESPHLFQNYPNPFNPRTRIEFQVAGHGFVHLEVVDVLGREVAVLVERPMERGTYGVLWDAGGAPSGLYFYRLQMGTFVATKGMMLVR